MGQLCYRTNTIAEEQESRILKSHGFKHLWVFSSFSGIPTLSYFPPCKYNWYMGQIQLRHRTNTIAEKQERRIWKSHGFNHLCVFSSLQIQLLYGTNTIVPFDKPN